MTENILDLIPTEKLLKEINIRHDVVLMLLCKDVHKENIIISRKGTGIQLFGGVKILEKQLQDDNQNA